MNAHIQNYRGLASADLDLSRICLLAGPNEAGKTSASQAVAAALTGDAIPISGVKKTQAGMLVRSGTATGSVELSTDKGKTNIQWPSAKVKTEGTAPFASHFATGLHSIVTLDDKERVRILTEYLKATPTRADLDAQLVNLNLPDNLLAQLWQLIETQGWDNAALQVKEKGARLKGQWQQATGEQYGSKKADSWIPEGYDDQLMGQSEDKLAAVVTDARDALEAAIAADAVDDSKRADLEALADLLPGRKIDLLAAEGATVDPGLAHQLTECNGMIKTISDSRDELSAQMKDLPTATQTAGMPCPDCGVVLQIKGSNLTHAAQLSADEITTRQEAITELNSKIISVNSAIAKHMEAAARIKTQIAEAENARTQKIVDCKRLVNEATAAAIELAKPVPAASPVSVDSCRTTLSSAETALKAYRAKFEADRLHVAIGHNAELLAKISPEGIRGDVLIRALKGFNESIAPICKAAGWRPVTLEADFMPTMGGTLYLLLSESAKFRVRVILQMGMAKLDKSEALVIDAADILDKTGRNGLFKALKAIGLPALVTMTIDGKDLVPDLTKAGIGASYWIHPDATAEAI